MVDFMVDGAGKLQQFVGFSTLECGVEDVELAL